jgi:signal transduction histidine kinase/CheY-like chemotaxis protein
VSSRQTPERAGWLGLHPQTWRDDLLRIVLRVTAMLGALVYVPSVWLAWVNSMWLVVVIDTIALGGVFVLARVERIPLRVRAAFTSLLFYMLGAGLMVTVGSISQIYLFAFSLFATVLMGLRWGLASVVINTVTLLGIGALGIIAPEMVAPKWVMDLPGWTLITANFTFVNLSLVLAFGAVIAALERSNRSLMDEVEQRKRSEDSLLRSRALLRIAGRTARLGGWEVNVKDRAVVWSDETRELHELPEGTQPSLDAAIEYFAPDSRRPIREALKQCLEDGTPFDLAAQLVTARGTPLWVRTIGSAERDEHGVITRVHGSLQDITPEIAAREREQKLELQLRQVQKMEAVGSLAGGIAHDFNNLLSVILSYSGFGMEDLGPEHPVHENLVEINKAGQRAAELTRQLLAFSRKQIISPEIVPLDRVVSGLEKMLRRLLTENITLSILTSPQPGNVSADVSQLEQLIVNLVVNARDAMPDGGQLTIETANVTLDEAYASEHADVKPGPYVMLAVTDTGIGMTRATQERIFEPFFTTKDKAKGTGLGLATVYGIVKQSGGHIWVYSELGVGTTFKLYLPRSDQEPSVQTAQPVATGTLRGTETVLLVEDQEQVRDVMRVVLRKAGYNVLETSNAGEALLVCEQFGATIHLMLTDVVMPHMSGRQLAERLKPIRPDMRVLYVSGYTENTIVHHGVLDAGIDFLTKPVTPEALLRKVRQVLDA